jgi:hypothetical protein
MSPSNFSVRSVTSENGGMSERPWANSLVTYPYRTEAMLVGIEFRMVFEMFHIKTVWMHEPGR